MTADAQNTVFPTVKAEPVQYVVLERCAVGADILHRRATAVRYADIETWWTAEGRGWLDYCRHVKDCDQCKTFEIAKRISREDLPTEAK